MSYLVTAFAAALTASTLSASRGRGVLAGVGCAFLRSVSHVVCLRLAVRALLACDGPDVECHIRAADIEVRVCRRTGGVPPA